MNILFLYFGQVDENPNFDQVSVGFTFYHPKIESIQWWDVKEVGGDLNISYVCQIDGKKENTKDFSFFFLLLLNEGPLNTISWFVCSLAFCGPTNSLMTKGKESTTIFLTNGQREIRRIYTSKKYWLFLSSILGFFFFRSGRKIFDFLTTSKSKGEHINFVVLWYRCHIWLILLISCCFNKKTFQI